MLAETCLVRFRVLLLHCGLKLKSVAYNRRWCHLLSVHSLRSRQGDPLAQWFDLDVLTHPKGLTHLATADWQLGTILAHPITAPEGSNSLVLDEQAGLALMTAHTNTSRKHMEQVLAFFRPALAEIERQLFDELGLRHYFREPPRHLYFGKECFVSLTGQKAVDQIWLNIHRVSHLEFPQPERLAMTVSIHRWYYRVELTVPHLNGPKLRASFAYGQALTKLTEKVFAQYAYPPAAKALPAGVTARPMTELMAANIERSRDEILARLAEFANGVSAETTLKEIDRDLRHLA